MAFLDAAGSKLRGLAVKKKKKKKKIGGRHSLDCKTILWVPFIWTFGLEILILVGSSLLGYMLSFVWK